MKAARIRLTKEVFFSLLSLPEPLTLEVDLRTCPVSQALAVEFVVSGDALPAAFEVVSGMRVPLAHVRYADVRHADGTPCGQRLAAIEPW